MTRYALCAIASALLVACSSSSSASRLDSPRVERRSPSASPTASQEDVAEIEAVVRAYFRAVATNDLTALERLTAGELHEFHRFSNDCLPAFGTTGRINFERVEVTTMAGNEAQVDLEATLTAQDGAKTTAIHYSDATVILDRGRWKLADYSKNGRVLSDAIHSVHGRAGQNGIEFNAVLAVLAADSVDVLGTVENHTDFEAVSLSTASIVTDGRWQQAHVGIGGVLSVPSGKKVTTVVSSNDGASADAKILRMFAEFSIDDFASVATVRLKL